MHTRRSNLRLGAPFRRRAKRFSASTEAVFSAALAIGSNLQTSVCPAHTRSRGRLTRRPSRDGWERLVRVHLPPGSCRTPARVSRTARRLTRPPLPVPAQEVHFLAEDEHLDIVPNFSLQGLHLLGGTVRPRALPSPRVVSFARVPPRYVPAPTPNPRRSPDARSTARSARRCAPACRCGSPCS